MLANTVHTKTKGDCDYCIRTGVELRIINEGRNSGLMCDECYAKEQAAKAAVKTIESSRKQDASLELKQDIFTASTVAFVELQAAIEADSTIAPDKKNYALMVEVAARIDKLSTVIFQEETALLEKKNERHALLVNAQNVAARLHESERAKFKQYDVNYKPPVVKTVKPPKPSKAPSNKVKFSKKELYDAAAKYNVPAAQVQQIVIARNLPPMEAAKAFAEMMGLL